MMKHLVVVLAAVAASASAAPTQRFDLECADSGDAGAPYTAHYRIDLVAKKWCEAECRAVKPIAGVQSSFLTLEGEPNSDFWHTIDREKGEDQIFEEDPTSHTSGECRRLPFSGFPSFKTKF